MSWSSRVARIVRRVIQGQAEVKATDAVSSATTVVTVAAPLVLPVTGSVAQGTDYFQRIANETKGLSLSVNFTFQLNVAASASVQYVRFMVVVDKDQAGTGLLLFNTLGTALFNSAAAPRITQLRSVLSYDRYTVIRDQIYSVSNGEETKRSLQHHFRLTARTHYLGTGTTSTANGPNSIYLIFLTDSAADGPQLVDVWSRYTFTDPQ